MATVRFRFWSVLTILALVFSAVLPLSMQSALAQSDELTQRDFDDLLDEAEENDPVYGPEDGELEHDPDIVTLAYADVDLTNFVAFAEFTNPYDGADDQFDMGIQIRITTDDDDEPVFARFIVISTGVWAITESGNDEVLVSGEYDDLNIDRSDENDLTVVAEDEFLHVAINGDYVGSAEVAYDGSGDIAVGTAFLADSFQEDEVTEFADFTIWSDEGGSRDDDEDEPTVEPTEENEDEEPTEEATRDDEDQEGELFEAEAYDFFFTVPSTWEITSNFTTDGDPNFEIISLTDGQSFIDLTLGPVAGGDSAACVETVQAVLISTLENQDITGDIEAGDIDEIDDAPDGTLGSTSIFTPDSGGDFPEITVYSQCGPSGSVDYLIGLVHYAPTAIYEDTIENRDALISTFNQDSTSTSDDEDEERPTEEPEDEPTAEADDDEEQQELEGTLFEGETYDFTLRAPKGWEVTSSLTTETDPPFEIINLGDETSVVQVILGPFDTSEPETCISTVVNFLLSSLESADITGELAAEELDSANGTTFATFTFSPDGDFPELTIYAECAPSTEGDYVIGLTHWAPASVYDDSVPGRESLVASFNQEGQPAPDPDDDDEDDDKPTREADSGDNLTANVVEGEDGLRIYTSPTFGLTVGILPGFTIEEDSVANGYDTLVVADSVGRATYSIFSSSNTPVGCINSIENNLHNDPTITLVQIATDENGAELRETGDGYSMFAVYLTFSNGLELGRFYACVGDPSINTMLVFAYETTAEQFPDEAENAVTMIELIAIEE